MCPNKTFALKGIVPLAHNPVVLFVYRQTLHQTHMEHWNTVLFHPCEWYLHCLG